MGRLLGLTNRSIKLMVGDKDNRKWSIRGLDKQGGPKTQLFDKSLEMARFKKALNDGRSYIVHFIQEKKKWTLQWHAYTLTWLQHCCDP